MTYRLALDSADRQNPSATSNEIEHDGILLHFHSFFEIADKIVQIEIELGFKPSAGPRVSQLNTKE